MRASRAGATSEKLGGLFEEGRRQTGCRIGVVPLTDDGAGWRCYEASRARALPTSRTADRAFALEPLVLFTTHLTTPMTKIVWGT
jgi:hypothetical protein